MKKYFLSTTIIRPSIHPSILHGVLVMVDSAHQE
jgi:hypothetical protein